MSNNISQNNIENEKTNSKSKIKTLFNKITRKPSKNSPTSPLSPSPSSTSSSSPKTQIEKVFEYIDENNDGKISPEELQHCVNNVGKQRLTMEEAKAAVYSSDSDKDGFLSVQDFELLLKGSEEEKTEELRAAFVIYSSSPSDNENGDGGVITPKSLKRILSQLGDSKTVEDCESMIQFYDVDGDGVLCFDEFLAMMN